MASRAAILNSNACHLLTRNHVRWCAVRCGLLLLLLLLLLVLLVLLVLFGVGWGIALLAGRIPERPRIRIGAVAGVGGQGAPAVGLTQAAVPAEPQGCAITDHPDLTQPSPDLTQPSPAIYPDLTRPTRLTAALSQCTSQSRHNAPAGCSTVALICFTCPAITVPVAARHAARPSVQPAAASYPLNPGPNLINQ